MTKPAEKTVFDWWLVERGQTVAEFADVLKRGRVTVHRWRLPEGAPEERRPRQADMRRITTISDGFVTFENFKQVVTLGEFNGLRMAHEERVAA